MTARPASCVVVAAARLGDDATSRVLTRREAWLTGPLQEGFCLQLHEPNTESVLNIESLMQE